MPSLGAQLGEETRSKGRGWTILGREGKSRPWVGSVRGGGWAHGVGEGPGAGDSGGAESRASEMGDTLRSLNSIIRTRRKEWRKQAVC